MAVKGYTNRPFWPFPISYRALIGDGAEADRLIEEIDYTCMGHVLVTKQAHMFDDRPKRQRRQIGERNDKESRTDDNADVEWRICW